MHQVSRTNIIEKATNFCGYRRTALEILTVTHRTHERASHSPEREGTSCAADLYTVVMSCTVISLMFQQLWLAVN